MRNSEILNHSNLNKEKLTHSLEYNQRESHPVSPTNLVLNQEEIFPRETLTNIYGDSYDIIQSKILVSEKETINYFSTILNNLNNKYDEFNQNINLHFHSVTNKITEAFKLNNPKEDTKNEQRSILIQKYSKEYLNQLNSIIRIHEEIFKNIKETISIFFNFLDIPKILDKEKPIHYFINQELNNIIQNWLFLKINVENFDFSKAINNTHVDSDFKKFIFKICKNKDFMMNVSSPRDYMIKSKKNFNKLDNETKNIISSNIETNKKIMSDNHSNIVKLKMNNVFFADKYFDKDLTYNKIKYLKFDNVTFSQDKNMNCNFLQNIPNLENLIINSSNNFEISILENLSKSLIKLSLTKNGFVDYEFHNIMSNYLVKSDFIRKNLQVLSFSNNNLSNVDISKIVNTSNQCFFVLRELNFEKNKIFEFKISLENFYELKCLNLCSNCFTSSYFDQFNNILTLLSGNVYLSNIKSAETYFSSLERKLNTSTISLSYLNLSYIPKILSNEYLSKIVINDSTLINIKKLDLSNNNIKNDTIFKFFGNNRGCLSLKLLNLSNNLLDDSFFEKYINLKLNNFFTNLKYIYLDSNRFGTYNKIDKVEGPQKMSNLLFQENNIEKEIFRIELLYKFIFENKNLVELTLTKNPVSNRYKIKNIDSDSENPYKKDENGNIQINGFHSFLFKIKLEILTLNNNNSKKTRNNFNLKFDCENIVNYDSANFDFDKYLIVNVEKKKMFN